MDYSEKIKELRNRISIPMDKAIELLKKNNGDLLLCETEFRNMDIAEICDKTMCTEKIVRSTYEKCGFDKIKTIERLNNREKIISTLGENAKMPKNEIGFTLFPARFGEAWGKIPISEHIFIRTSDFDYIIDMVKSVFPLVDPETQEEQKYFDICSRNRIHKNTWKSIITQLNEKNYGDDNIDKFIREVVAWLNDKLEWADEIMIDGNL